MGKRCIELSTGAPLEFVVAVERFRTVDSVQLPSVAHDIVDAHMAKDAASRVVFCASVQQELIETQKPHRGMFDNAQKEALHILQQVLCPTSPATLRDTPK